MSRRSRQYRPDNSLKDFRKGVGRAPESALPEENDLLMAAAGDEKKRDDDEPDPVVVEYRAKAIVIHK